MEQNPNPSSNQTRRAAVGGLAVVGFIALILIGIATAIYAASFLPKAFSRLSSANVYLSSVEQPSGSTQNTQVPVGTTTAPTSVPLSPATTPTQPAPVVTPTPAPAPTPKPTYVPQTYVAPTQVVVPSQPTLYGLPDLTVSITSVGYLRNSGDTSSFVSSDTVPAGSTGAVRFVVSNRGTNVSGNWNFQAILPTNDNSSDYRSAYQRSLNPGDSVVYTLGFDTATNGSNSIRVNVDPNNYVQESNESNNTDSASIYFTRTTRTAGGSYDSNGNYCTYGTYYQNGRYYCQSSYTNTQNYDSNGNYCSYGTYYQNGRYYCDTSTSSNGGSYDTNGNYCRYGTYYQNGRYYCQTGTTNYGSYDSNGNYCSYGTYLSNNRTYCY